MWLFELRLVFTYHQEKLLIIWNVRNTYGHVLLAYSGGFHVHRYSEGGVILWVSSKNWRQGDQLLHACQIHFKKNHLMASEVVKRRAMSHERNWNLFWTLSSSTKREQKQWCNGAHRIWEHKFRRLLFGCLFICVSCFSTSTSYAPLPSPTPNVFDGNLWTGDDLITETLTALDLMRQKIAAISLCLCTSSSRRRYTCTICSLSLSIASVCIRFTSSKGQERNCKTMQLQFLTNLDTIKDNVLAKIQKNKTYF